MSAVATRTTVELLRSAPLSQRGVAVTTALANAAASAGIDVRQTQRPTGRCPWLLLWGPGALDRVEPMRRQIAAGGHVIALDLAYWSRDRKFRVSIDGAHPQNWVMRRDWPRARFEADPVAVSNAWNPDGPVVCAGIGEKARVQYGAAVPAWEASMIAECRARGLDVRYRPKKNGTIPAGVTRAWDGAIEGALRGASLVITWHSNVAVDAIRMGIPVICREGAAAAVCASTWASDGRQRPLATEVRDRFLTNLAWFQWAPSEAVHTWRFLLELLQ